MIILYLLSCATSKDSENVINKKDRVYEKYQRDEQISQSSTQEKKSEHEIHPKEVQQILPPLVSRHSLPCHELAKTSIETLNYVVENIKKPPWAAMRSAQCMLEMYPSEGTDIYQSWIDRSETLGLAILIADQIEYLSGDPLNTLFPHFSNSPHLEKIKSIVLRHKEYLEKQLSKENLLILHSWET